MPLLCRFPMLRPMNMPLRTSAELAAQYVPWQAPERPAWLPPSAPAVPTLELVDTLAVAKVLDGYWHCAADSRGSMLLIDPEARWAPGIMKQLAAQTEGDESLVRVISAVGVRTLATVSEIELPATSGRPDAVRSLECRQADLLTRSPSLEKLLAHTRQVTMLLGNLPPQEAAAWIQAAQAMAQRLGERGPQWNLFVRFAAHERPAACANAPWLKQLRFITQPATGQAHSGTADLSAAVFEAWSARPCARAIAGQFTQ